jgi:putative ATPase
MGRRSAAERVAQRVTAVYDKGREEHYNLISALHKAVRNSDPDAALYWLARMLEGGADARYVVRRMLRMASEDIGMADPRALQQVSAAAHAVEHVGMPVRAGAGAGSGLPLGGAGSRTRCTSATGRRRRRAGGARPAGAAAAAQRADRADAGGRVWRGLQYAHDEPGGVADMECLRRASRGRGFRARRAGWEAKIRERLEAIEGSAAESVDESGRVVP